eukprot:TRINITY_DN4169_c0_g1_i4.p1 TRINITY_DN4169_c0_g1~~TRINITY_DN4169_c0_g1_i4.p1  ORF type:complete len:480 (-),score=183.65 TRINITY_DN4169_c0_g1_i4:3-1442(-)
MIVRFDDTNPANEKGEYEKTIMKDLEILGVQIDQLTHTSDHFATLLEKGTWMIQNGLAYIDNTDIDTMRELRFNKQPSPLRDTDVATNMALWEEMQKGSEEGLKCVVRAKIAYDSDNASLRDPAIYRCQLFPHHITGHKYKVYPTYDFACPIVDSIEGVTHALRTNEYHDRNEQYQWFIDAMNLRKVHIWDYSRINFAYTLMSKRKLAWFVDNGKVRGWDDPRFPTVGGMMRQGLQIQALTKFMLDMGASKNSNLMSFTKLWNENKKVIDPIAEKYHTISVEGVPLTLTDGPTEPCFESVPRHRQNPELGQKMLRYSRNLLLEPEDANLLNDGDEITLMHWGNIIIDEVQRDANSDVTAVVAHLHLDGDFKKTEHKFTWVADDNHKVVVHVTKFDDLLSKKKLEEGDDYMDFLNPVTEKTWDTFAEASVRHVEKGQVIQFERRGYFICDVPYVHEGDPMVFFHIPDGHQVENGYLIDQK